MRNNELRDLTMDELREKHLQSKEELFNLRFQNAIGQLGNSGRIREVKRNIARILTVITEKEMGFERPTVRG